MYKLVKKFKSISGEIHIKEKTYEVNRKTILKVVRQAAKKYRRDEGWENLLAVPRKQGRAKVSGHCEMNRTYIARQCAGIGRIDIYVVEL
jgi:hypothetical protein